MNINDFNPRNFTKEEELWNDVTRVSEALGAREPAHCTRHMKQADIDCFDCQTRIKYLSYCIFEEVCEAYEPGQEFHTKEELADAAIFLNRLNFVVKGYSGISHHNLHMTSFNEPVIEFFTCLGLMTNTLKLRPWRKSFTYTDRNLFFNRLSKTNWAFENLCHFSFKNKQEFLDMVDLKAQVNDFRVRSNY